MTRSLAVFDFDATLAKGDSLWPFLVKAAGRTRCMIAVLAAAGWCLSHPLAKDKRTAIKEILLKITLAGRTLGSLQPAISAMQRWPVWLPAAEALKEHHKHGDHVVIASGSLDLYMPAMLEGLPYDALLCTEMEVVDGTLTGRMRNGNCVRLTKAERVASYILRHGPFQSSRGYGNPPHDLPMLSLLDEQTLIKKR